MEQVQHSFRRYEKKFLLTQEQYRALLSELREEMEEDQYGVHTVCNIYFDTDRFDLIRASVDKPAYKEKFRLRSYGIPKPDGTVFAEIKKKSEGIVYKRRVDATPSAIWDFVRNGRELCQDQQIQREIRWFLRTYCPVPKVFIGYERVALVGRGDEDLRVTFDWNIRWRRRGLDLSLGDDGELILQDNRVVLEVKVPAAIPLWLASLLSRYRIYSTSFSKYGTCYQHHLVTGCF